MRIRDQESEGSSNPAISLILSKTEFAQALTSLCYIISHANTHKLCSIFDKTQIFRSHNVKTKKQDLLRSKKRTYLRIHLNSEVYYLQEKITLKVFFLNRTHFMSRAWPTRLYIWSNPTYVSALGCLCTFDPIQPTFPH